MSKIKAYQYTTDRETGKRKIIKHYVDRTEATRIAKTQAIVAKRMEQADYIVKFDGEVIKDDRTLNPKSSIEKKIKSWFTPYRVKVKK